MIVRSVREHLFGEDVESAYDFSDQDDFDFYGPQQQDNWNEAGGRNEYNAQLRSDTLPAEEVDLSNEDKPRCFSYVWV